MHGVFSRSLDVNSEIVAKKNLQKGKQKPQLAIVLFRILSFQSHCVIHGVQIPWDSETGFSYFNEANILNNDFPVKHPTTSDLTSFFKIYR